MRKYNLDKIFGTAGTAAGMLLFIVGLYVLLSSFIGLVLVFIGAFIGFTYTSTLLDAERKRIKLSNNFFGIIPYGNWIEIRPEMKIGLKRNHRGYRVYSKSNRSIDSHNIDVRIILYGGDNEDIIPVCKFKSIESAREEIEKLRILLILEIK